MTQDQFEALIELIEAIVAENMGDQSVRRETAESWARNLFLHSDED